MDIGINLMGAEWVSNSPSDALGTTYYFPSEAEIDYYAAKGFSHIRLPIAWERIQPDLNGKLDPAYVAEIQKTIDYAKSQGMDVVLDVHNYASYDGNAIGSANVPTSAFTDLWSKIATAFADDTNVRFDLMNEPQVQSQADWVNMVNDALTAIRKAGANQQVIIQGAYRYDYWDGKVMDQTAQTEAVGTAGVIKDPAGNIAFDLHVYLDNGSGQNDWVVSETIGVERLTAITDWARANGVKLYLGEFGVADNAKSLAALDNMLQYLSKNQDVWQSVAYWAGGQTTGDYMFSAEPDYGLLDVPQMQILDDYTGLKGVTINLGDGTVRHDFYPNGQETPSISDVVDAKGNLISRTLFNANGDERSQAVMASDGGVTVTTFTDPGESIAFERDVYDAGHHLLSRALADATGAMTVKYYHPGDIYNTYREEVYKTNGTMDYAVDHTAGGGNTITHYDGTHISMVEVYDPTWRLVSRETFNNLGQPVQIQADNLDGTHSISQVNPLTGLVSSETDYTADWRAFAVTTFDSHENPVLRTTTFADGTRQLDYYVSGEKVLDHSDTMTADNKLASRIVYQADGYVNLVYAPPGSSIVAQSTLHTTDGDVVSLTKYDLKGLIVSVEHYNADGGYTQEHYTAANQQHATTADTYDAKNRLVSHTEFDTNGHAISVDTQGSDGSQSIRYFVDGTNVVAKMEVFDSTGTLTSRTNYDAAGLIDTIQRYSADGTHTVETYSAANQAHATEIDLYDSSNRLVTMTMLATDGSVASIDTLDSAGNHTVQYFEAGTEKVSKIEILTFEGHLVTRTTFDAAGLVASVQSDNADGTHAVANYDADHQTYPVFTDVFDASWNIASRTYFDANGKPSAMDQLLSDGGHKVSIYDGGNSTPTRVETYTGAWQLQDRTTYNTDGSIASIQYDNADGSHTVATYDASHQLHPAYADVFNAKWAVTSRTYFDTDGNKTSTDNINADGTHTVENFIAGTSKTSSVELYDAGWHLQERTSFDAAGLITKVLHENADGSHTIENYSAAVQKHATFTDQFDANWTMLNRSYYNDSTLSAQIEKDEVVGNGVAITGRGSTVLTNHGQITSNAFAIEDTTGTLNLVNKGTIEGDISLGAGNDVVDLRSGDFSGTIRGGAGDDTFRVADASVKIVEARNGGIDTVESTKSFTLGANIERLTLLNKTNLSGTGNELDNILTGNDGNNKLDGGKGADTMIGGNGNDTYYVDNAKDVVIETGKNDNHDTINTTISMNLAKLKTIEDVVLLGSNGIDVHGNASDNILTGNKGNNEFWGGAGNDTLKGGGGIDTFHFVKGDAFDTIMDFDAKGADHDVIDLSDYGSKKLKFASLDIEHVKGGDVEINFGNGDTLHVHFTASTAKDLDASDFLF